MPDTLVRPAHLWVPPRVGSYGDEAVDLAAMAGRVLDPEQRLAVDATLSYGPGGRWVALEAAVVKARQNGKTGGDLLPVVLFDLFLLPPDRIVWTAHLFKTARDAFADFVALITGCAELSRRVKRIVYANGEEAVELHSGARLEFLARSKGGGRGLGGKRLVMDEAGFVSAESMGAIIPILSARPDPQICYGASAAVGESDQLRALRDRGRAGGDPSLVWAEWCAPGSWESPGCSEPRCSHTVGSAGCALDDESLWPAANPALPGRISYEYVRAERRALSPHEFGRERLGWHDEADGLVQPIPMVRWAAAHDPAGPDPLELRPAVFSFDVSYDRSRAAVGVAARRPDGLAQVEVADHRNGTAWVVPRLVELRERWSPSAIVLDVGSPAASLLPELAEAGIVPEPLGAADVKQAVGGFYDAVMGEAPTVRHRNQRALNDALEGAGRRDLGDGWAWSRRFSTSDISPLVAVTNALHGLAVFGGSAEPSVFSF
jgi:hypothetical protein